MKRILRSALVAVAASCSAVAFATPPIAAATTWSLQEVPTPVGSTQTDVQGVSCPTATACVAAGTAGKAGSASTAFGATWNGTKWTLQESLKPAGATESYLDGISCASSSVCVAVGSFRPSTGPLKPLAEIWNGTAWTATEPPVTTENQGSLTGVSCTSSTSCEAVGVTGAWPSQILIDYWDGTRWWTEQPAHTASSYSLLGVSCLPASSSANKPFCFAAGRVALGGGTYNAEVEYREEGTGSQWNFDQLSQKGQASSAQLNSVSCVPGPHSCIAVGESEEEKETRSFAETWNGLSSWTGKRLEAKSSALNGISCYETPEESVTFGCVAVGHFTNASGMVAPLANMVVGNLWPRSEPPIPTGATSSGLEAVSCSARLVCTAVGSFVNTSSERQPLVERFQ
jgi:hypothetical protein